MLPVVSVVIPTYRHEQYVEDTLASVFAQTFTDYEVIVINDGSPDETAARLRPLADAGRIRYFEQENAGQSAARNRGLAEARGEFVAYLDDDDLWPPDKLEWQVAALRGRPDWTAAGGTCALIDEHGTLSPKEADTHRVEVRTPVVMFEGNPMRSPGQSLIRRAALHEVGGWDPGIWGSDDWDLWIRLAAHGPFALIDRCALYYRLHATNASHAAGRMFWSGVRVIRKNLHLLPRPQRARAERVALLDVYHFSGTKVVSEVHGGGARGLWRALRVVGYLLGPCLRDSFLAASIGRDLLPRRWRRAQDNAASADGTRAA